MACIAGSGFPGPPNSPDPATFWALMDTVPNILPELDLAPPSADMSGLFHVKPPQSTRIDAAEVITRTREAMARNMKSVMVLRDSCLGETALICGGGPSLVGSLGRMRTLYKRGQKIICTNKTYDWLVQRNFKPWAVVLLDPMPHVAEYVKLHTPKTRVLIAGQCHADTFAALNRADCYLWHADASDPNPTTESEVVPGKVLRDEYPLRSWRVMAGGNTGGLRSIFLAQFMGFRRAELFGFDGSERAGSLYAYDKPAPADAAAGPATLRINGHEQEFMTNEHMARQTELFTGVLRELETMRANGVWDDLVVHGDGMLPCLAAGYGMHADPEMNRKWGKSS